MALETALIVDDSKSARVMLSRLLGKKGLSVDLVESADEAFDYLASKTPDVVFMDHMMPGTDGLTATRRISKDPSTAQVPVVMYTSKEDPAYLQEALSAGAVGVLPKPAKSSTVDKILAQIEAQSTQHAAQPGVPAVSEGAMATASTEVAAQAVQHEQVNEDEQAMDSDQFWAYVGDVVRGQVNECVGSLVTAKIMALSNDLAAQMQKSISAEVDFHLKKTTASMDERVTLGLQHGLEALNERFKKIETASSDAGHQANGLSDKVRRSLEVMVVETANRTAKETAEVVAKEILKASDPPSMPGEQVNSEDLARQIKALITQRLDDQVLVEGLAAKVKDQLRPGFEGMITETHTRLHSKDAPVSKGASAEASMQEVNATMVNVVAGYKRARLLSYISALVAGAALAIAVLEGGLLPPM